MAQTFDSNTIDDFVPAPTGVTLGQLPLRIVRVPGDHTDIVSLCDEPLRKPGRVRCISGRLRSVMESDDRNSEIILRHRQTIASAEEREVYSFKRLLANFGCW